MQSLWEDQRLIHLALRYVQTDDSPVKKYVPKLPIKRPEKLAPAWMPQVMLIVSRVRTIKHEYIQRPSKIGTLQAVPVGRLARELSFDLCRSDHVSQGVFGFLLIGFSQTLDDRLGLRKAVVADKPPRTLGSESNDNE